MSEELLADRYGRTRRRPWVFPAIVVLLLATAVAWTLWVALDHADKPVTAQVYGYTVVNDHQIKVTIQVKREAGTKAVCTVNAQALDHSIVGERDVAVPVTTGATTRVQAVVETERRAVAAELKGCVLKP